MKHLLFITVITLSMLTGTMFAQTGSNVQNNKEEVSDKGGPYPISPWLSNGDNIYFNTGNIGIGTINPDMLLHLNSSKPGIKLETTGQTWKILNDTELIFASSQMHSRDIEFTKDGYIIAGGFIGDGSKLSNLPGFWTADDNGIVYANGNVTIRSEVIGDDMLDVVNDAPANTVDENYSLIWGAFPNIQSSNPGLISFSTWASGSKHEIFKVRNNGTMRLGHKSTGNYNIAFKVTVDNNLTKAFQVTNSISGEPEFMLMGDGKVYCREVIVTLDSWMDKVFDPAYDLLSLNEVEQFIDTNGHLPEIPSEEEIIENGLETSEIIKLQMQKIEELTLYTIEQQKEIDELKEQNEKIKDMEDKIEELSKIFDEK